MFITLSITYIESFDQTGFIPGSTEANVAINKNKKVHLLMCRICYFKLVQQVGTSLHPISEEIARWREVLDMPYQEYLSSK